jgi:hypothetical protein
MAVLAGAFKGGIAGTDAGTVGMVDADMSFRSTA